MEEDDPTLTTYQKAKKPDVTYPRYMKEFDRLEGIERHGKARLNTSLVPTGPYSEEIGSQSMEGEEMASIMKFAMLPNTIDEACMEEKMRFKAYFDNLTPEKRVVTMKCIAQLRNQDVADLEAAERSMSVEFKEKLELTFIGWQKEEKAVGKSGGRARTALTKMEDYRKIMEAKNVTKEQKEKARANWRTAHKEWKEAKDNRKAAEFRKMGLLSKAVKMQKVEQAKVGAPKETSGKAMDAKGADLSKEMSDSGELVSLSDGDEKNLSKFSNMAAVALSVQDDKEATNATDIAMGKEVDNGHAEAKDDELFAKTCKHIDSICKAIANFNAKHGVDPTEEREITKACENLKLLWPTKRDVASLQVRSHLKSTTVRTNEALSYPAMSKQSKKIDEADEHSKPEKKVNIEKLCEQISSMNKDVERTYAQSLAVAAPQQTTAAEQHPTRKQVDLAKWGEQARSRTRAAFEQTKTNGIADHPKPLGSHPPTLPFASPPMPTEESVSRFGMLDPGNASPMALSTDHPDAYFNAARDSGGFPGWYPSRRSTLGEEVEKEENKGEEK